MKVGVDFDNTIVCCDELFYRAAAAKDLIQEKVPVTKEEVRNHLRKIGREDDWTELQGYVYGSLIQEAPAFSGVKDFFVHCRERGIMTAIISHKTRQPYLGPPYDLHKAAYAWLEKNGFFDGKGVEHAQVFFELKKEDKLRRIGEEQCTVFIDDLPEFLTEPHFPAGVQRVLFDPQKKHTAPKDIRQTTSWNDIERLLLPR